MFHIRSFIESFGSAHTFYLLRFDLLHTLMQKLYVIAFLLFFYSCSKKDGDDTPSKTPILQYFGYEAGTYWIYRDSATGVLDSIAVYRRDVGYGGPVGGTYKTSYLASCTWIHDHGSIIDTIIYNVTENELFMTWGTRFMGNYGSYWVTAYPFQVPGSRGASQYLRILPSMMVNNVSYTDVEEVHIAENSSAGYWNDWLYVEKEHGIIKMRLSHPLVPLSRTLELVRSKIVIN
jgi:hypothetical protein